MSSTSDPPDIILEAGEPDEEKQEEDEQEVEEQEQETEDNTDTDVLYAGEVKGDGKEVTMEEKQEEASTEERGGTGPGGPPMAGRDWRTKYKEVITNPM